MEFISKHVIKLVVGTVVLLAALAYFNPARAHEIKSEPLCVNEVGSAEWPHGGNQKTEGGHCEVINPGAEEQKPSLSDEEELAELGAEEQSKIAMFLSFLEEAHQKVFGEKTPDDVVDTTVPDASEAIVVEPTGTLEPVEETVVTEVPVVATDA